ncbi:MAG: L,D-transpeptidase [Bacteroidia bacterium]|nr:L,D-transpeptidase [Bacteroidia bacterium]
MSTKNFLIGQTTTALAVLLLGCSPSPPPPEGPVASPRPAPDTLAIYTPPRLLPLGYTPGATPPAWVDTFQVLSVSVRAQTLTLYELGQPTQTYPISTAARGIGSREGSLQTPLGRHRICRKIGAGLPLGAVLRNGQYLGEVAKLYTDTTDVADDLVTTRLLWLEGLEPGANQGPGVDSFWRFIYIHGTPEEGLIGRPASHGCIRMRNADVVELFDRVRLGSLVVVQP